MVCSRFLVFIVITGISHVHLVRVGEIKINVNGMLSNQCMFSLFLIYLFIILMLYSEKYVTRAEYDELKNRFDQLEAFVHHRLGGTIPPAPLAIPPPYYQSAIPSGLPGTVSEPGPSSFSQSFSQPPPPSMIYHQQQQHIMPPPPHPSYSPRQSPSVRPQQSPSSLARVPPPPKPQSSPQHLPHSLASITSPYNIEQQSKNSYAQMLKLGERLRPITNVSRRVAVVRP